GMGGGVAGALGGVPAGGGLRLGALAMLRDPRRGPRRDGDERFVTVTARRPVLEAAVAAVASRTPGVTIRRGVAVTGLLADPPAPGRRVAQVRGVLVAGGPGLPGGPAGGRGGRPPPPGAGPGGHRR